MSDVRYAQAKKIFLAVCDLPAEQRLQALARHCGEDADLYSEVRSLLSFHDETIDSPSASSGESAAGAPPARIGAYRLVRRVGEGGMGQVWEAEQEQPVRRRVALKLIKWGMDSREVVARFDTERQALALMSHPNIARVYDVGATEQGRPYFAMEFVEGVPLTDYCERHDLSTRRRLELFLQICDGVQHAHQKGVIHRDLKPSNVLVASESGVAVPKIIDFGIARATDPGAERTSFTRAGQAVGTPAYMSPEQAGASGDIDTRSDVYSLGVMLYELLVGRIPIEGDGFDDLKRRILDEEPVRPSGAESRRSDTDPKLLARRLRGDLDWITMKALEKQRSRRYRSPAELASDIRRHLADEPVTAGPPGAAYRVGKFVRRHRLGVAAAGIVLVTLVAGAAAATWGLVRARRAEAVAMREAAASEKVSHLLVGLFELAGPDQARGEMITAREVIDAASERVETELADQPAMQARLLVSLGSVYRGLGLFDRAEAQFERAFALREETATDEVLAENLFDLAWVAYARGDRKRGVELADRSFELGRRVFDENDPRWAKMLLGKVLICRDEGELDDCIDLARRALSIWDRHPDSRDPFVGYTLDNLASLLIRRRDLDEAEALLDRAERFRIEMLGPGHPDLRHVWDERGGLAAARGEYEQARAHYARVLELEERVLGPEHPDLIDSLVEMGTAHSWAGEHAEAERMYGRALAIAERTVGKENPELVGLYYRVGAARHRARDYEQARSYYARALTIAGTMDRQHRELPDFLNEYGNLQRIAGDSAGALGFYDRAMQAALGRNGKQDPAYARAACNGGFTHETRRQWQEALPYFRACLEGRQSALPAGHALIGWAHNSVGYSLVFAGETAAARPHLERAQTILEEQIGRTHTDFSWIEQNFGSLEMEEGRHELARQHLERALRLAEDGPGPDSLRVSSVLHALARNYALQGKWAEARPVDARAVAIDAAQLSPGDANLARSHYNLACVDARLGNREDAMRNLRLAMENGFRWEGIEDDPDVDSLRDLPEFRSMLAEVRRRNREAAE